MLEVIFGSTSSSFGSRRSFLQQGRRSGGAGKARADAGHHRLRAQLNGDLAFASVKPAGAAIKASETFADIETVKAVLELSSPVDRSDPGSES